MFDAELPEPAELAGSDDAAVVAAIAGWARVEAAAAARRLAAIGELLARRTRGDAAGRSRWSCDFWDGAAAEVAAAQHISHAMASGQMYLASALRDRLPGVAALFVDGQISARLVSTMVWHTTLIQDPDVLAQVDEELAECAGQWGPLSAAKTAAAIDVLIDRHDPAAVRRQRDGARGREVVIDTRNSQAGITGLWGRLFATDAAALEQRLNQLAQGVCAEDPRTLAQRRADALGALAVGAESLACGCGGSHCPAADAGDGRAAAVLIHVVAEEAALAVGPDAALSGERPAPPPMTVAEALAAEPDVEPVAATAASGQVVGGGVVPAARIAELIAGGAKVKPLRQSAELIAETGYRPSAALAAFVRARDLTCRFPGCDRPATFCDIDHAIAYPHGPTHVGNLRCLCRKHHLLKTFWTGPTGWSDHQHPDGSIDWTSPTGATYTTRPGSVLVFPTLCRPTGPPPATPTPPTAPHRPGRNLLMPLRKRTRSQDRTQRVRAERAHNTTQLNAERNKAAPP